MKRITIVCAFFIVFFLTSMMSEAQNIYDFKVKNPINEKDRTMMLDILRANLFKDYKQEFVFVVNHFKVGNGYAWFMGNATRKDGQKVRVKEYDDCCHVEALFSKRGNKWYIETSSAFSTDTWYIGLSKKYVSAPRGIFDQVSLMR